MKISYSSHLPVLLYHETLKSKRTFHIVSSISIQLMLYVGKKEGRERGAFKRGGECGGVGVLLTN